MNTKKQILAGSLAITIVLSSCSIKKRMYTAGYHVEWKHNRSKLKQYEPLTSASREIIFPGEEKINEIAIGESLEQSQIKNNLVASNQKSSIATYPVNKNLVLFNRGHKENELDHQTQYKHIAAAQKKETDNQERGPIRFMLRIILLLILVIVLIALVAMLL